MFVPTIAVGLRVLAKWMVGKRLDRSDACIFMALLLNYGLQGNAMMLVMYGGLGTPFFELYREFGNAPAQFLFKGLVSFNILWNCVTMCSKLSVLLLFTNLIPVRRMILPARALMAFVTLSHISYIVAQFLICHPAAKVWELFTPGVCGNIITFYTVMGVSNIVADLVILALPMPFIYSLTLEWPKKAILFGMFAVGLLTSAISIYRQTLLPDIVFWDTTGASLMAAVFSALEPAVAITLACIPYLVPLARRWSLTKKSATYHERPYTPYAPDAERGRSDRWMERGQKGVGVTLDDDGQELSRFESSQVQLQLVKVESDINHVSLLRPAGGESSSQAPEVAWAKLGHGETRAESKQVFQGGVMDGMTR
ncbi:hypothetical protein MN608_00229 [Microdochium nivale]|nr:hypothetical protein MN608_00229 [Microdochium nivale]